MKRLWILTSIIYSCFVLIPNSEAALGAGTVWDVRASGNINNGGGFDDGVAAAGTDFSLQDAAQDTGTDLASADGDADPCIVTSASHNFVAADEGNLIKIHETGDGFTLGYYLIDDTAGNAATLDRACGTDGAKTGGDWNYGGGTDHPNTISAVVVAGNDIFIESGGTYQPVGANAYVISATVSGTSTNPIRWIGYITNHSTVPTGDDRPLLDANSVASSDVITANVLRNYWYYLRLTGAADDGFTWGTSTDDSMLYGIKSFSNGSAGLGSGNSDSLNVMYTELSNNSGQGSSSRTMTMRFVNVHDNTSDGWVGNCNSSLIGTFVVSESNGGKGFDANGCTSSGSGVLHITNCVAYNNTGASSDGFEWDRGTGNGSGAILLSNSSVSNGAFAFQSVNGEPPWIFDYNNYFGHTTELSNITAGANDTGDDDPLFTAAGDGDFTYQSGSPCLDAGVQIDTDLGGVGDNKVNIGIGQNDAAAVERRIWTVMRNRNRLNLIKREAIKRGVDMNTIIKEDINRTIGKG